MMVENRLAFRDEPVDLPKTRFYAETAQKEVAEWDPDAILPAKAQLLAQYQDPQRRMIGGWKGWGCVALSRGGKGGVWGVRGHVCQGAAAGAVPGPAAQDDRWVGVEGGKGGSGGGRAWASGWAGAWLSVGGRAGRWRRRYAHTSVQWGVRTPGGRTQMQASHLLPPTLPHTAAAAGEAQLRDVHAAVQESVGVGRPWHILCSQTIMSQASEGAGLGVNGWVGCVWA